jgi:6-phosphogluconolactonase
MTLAAARADIVIAGTVAALVETAAGSIRGLAANAIAARGRFRIALAGGSSRARCTRTWSPASTGRAPTSSSATSGRCRPTIRSRTTGWRARRCLNRRAFLDANVFRWQAESPDLDAAARDYEQALRARDAPPWIDLALLGLGPDGHTASLFPGTAALAVEDRLAVAVEVPQLATRRLTLTYPALLGAAHVVFLVAGRENGLRWPTSFAPGARCPPPASFSGRPPFASCATRTRLKI